LAALAALACAACALADAKPGATGSSAYPTWRPVSAATASVDPAQLVSDFPDGSSVRLRLLNAQLRNGDRPGALQSLTWLKAHGHVFSDASQQQIRALLDELGESSRDLILAKPAVIDRSRELALVPAEAQLVEAAAMDARSGRLFATSVVSRLLWIRERDGSWRGLDIGDVDSLSGVVLDPCKRRLWVAASNLGMGSGPKGAFKGLIAIDPDRLTVVRKIAAPDGVNPSDIALGRGGVLFASDPIGGGVYRARPRDELLSILVPPGTFRSPQGLAESHDGTQLYLSDYRYGLAAVSLQNGSVSRVSAAAGLIVPLDGIDGLWRFHDRLIVVQNGTSPKRILSLRLDRQGKSIIETEVLEQAHPSWTEPLSGSIAGDSLIYVATGQWDRFENGAAIGSMPPVPTQLRMLNFAQQSTESG
jgi:hypothetical protein